MKPEEPYEEVLDLKWTRELIDESQREVYSESGLSDVKLSLELIKKYSSGDARLQLKAFHLITRTVQNSSWIQQIKEKEVSDLVELGFSLLQVNGVKPYKSSLDFLYGEILIAKAVWLFATGHYQRAYFELSVIPQFSKYINDDQSIHIQELYFKVVLRLGSPTMIEEAIKLFKVLPEDAYHILLLRGDSELFRKHVTLLNDSSKTWWTSVAKCYQGDISDMIALLKPKYEYRSAHRLLTAKLWAFAASSSIFSSRIPSMDWIKRTYSDELKRDQKLKSFAESVVLLEKSLDLETPMVFRLQAMEDALNKVHMIPTIQDELLFYASLARIAYRSRQYALSQRFYDLYQEKCAHVSPQGSKDAIGIMKDFEKAQISSRIFLKKKSKDHEAPIEGSYKRKFALLSLFSSSLIKWSTGTVVGALSGDEKRKLANAKLYQELAERIVSRLDHLKGAAMKFGQLVAFMHPYLSSSVQEELNTILDSATSLPSDTVDAIFESSFQSKPKSLFKVWNEEAIAAASIGQVHYAQNDEGQELAVKVQYPRIDESISSDMNSFLILKPIFRQIYPRVDLKGIIEEVRDRFVEECDYDLERERQIRFRELFEDEDNIVIPRVCAPTTSKDVIVTEFVYGKKYSEVSGLVDQELSNHYGVLLFRFFIRSLVKAKSVYCDPNPGNFLFEDKQVKVLDFGLVKMVDDAFIESIKLLFLASIEKDVQKFKDVIAQIGLSKHESGYDYETHFDMFLGSTANPWKHDQEFQFNEDYLKHEIETNLLVNPIGRHIFIPPELFLIMRGYVGIVSLLCGLNAKANWHQILKEEFEDHSGEMKKTS